MSENRDVIVTVRFTQVEFDRLLERAERDGRKRSDMLRWCFLQYDQKERGAGR